MNPTITRRAFAAGLMAPLGAAALLQEWRAGASARTITPREPLWMAGYAARTRPSEGTAQDLFARALALEDPQGVQAVVVAADVLAFPASLSRRIARAASERFGLARERLLLNASHTHAGPVVGETLRVAYPGMTAEHDRAVERYTAWLEEEVLRAIAEALASLAPARLAFGRSRAGFAMNRRRPQPRGPVSLQPNPGGPVDHDVPVLRVERPDGRLTAALYGYACHCTTLGGDFYQFHGDYAGCASAGIESRHPGSVALFLAGCGGDANPEPRGTVELAQRHGEALGRAVEEALASARLVEGGLRCAYAEAPLAFAPPPTREQLLARIGPGNDQFAQRHARLLLDTLNRRGRLPAGYPCPVQVWRIGNSVTLVPLAGEVVVDYSLRLKRELGPSRTWVAGYSNDVFAYIPSLRVLNEGGYEGEGAMIYYGQPGPFAYTVEETIVGQVHRLVRKTDA